MGKGRAYVSMSRGWALGSAKFRAALVEDFDLAASARAWEVGGAQEMRRVRCEKQLAACLRAVGKKSVSVAGEPKGPPELLGFAAGETNEALRTKRNALESQTGPFPGACSVRFCDSTSPVREAVAWP